MTGSMDGKVVVITGAGGGIGRAAALLFADEGARLVVNDLGADVDGTGADPSRAEEVAAAVRERGGLAVAHHGDVAVRADVEAMIGLAVREYGRVDALVNSAGILRDRTLLRQEDADWDAVVGVHLRGAFLCTQLAARQMISQGEGGRIVHTTSVAGLQGSFGQASYSAAKAGVYGLTRTAAIELQRHRITVNALAPIAKTRMTEDLPMFHGKDSMTPEHVAPAAVFLGSPLAGDRTGFVLAVSGSRMYAYKLVEADGRFKEGGRPWTPAEIAEHWDSITRAR
ncbi:MAG: SDR family NAD(P)-dependent oxidoreductase [Polyangiaceae bacterium]|nr:SDR family NAD(P)-dependent oxidoreductase [Polyangiaceae bacterium]